MYIQWVLVDILQCTDFKNMLWKPFGNKIEYMYLYYIMVQVYAGDFLLFAIPQ